MATTATQPQVLPKEVRLSAPPTMPQARSYLFRQQSSLPTAQAGSTITINLPRLQRSYLTKDSYLRFNLNLTVTPGAAGATNAQVFLDNPGAYGLIDKIEVFDYLGSTLLESTSGHGELLALLQDCSMSHVQKQGFYNILTGTMGGLTGSGTLPAGIIRASKCGELLTTGSTSATAVQITREYALPVFSFLGLLSDKFAPLHNGYTIVLTLNNTQNAFVTSQTADGLAASAANPSFTLSDIFYECQILELGPVAESMLLSSTQGQPLVVAAKAFRQYVGTIATSGNVSQYRMDLNLNVASLTNVLFILRRSANINAANRFTLGERIRNFLSSWYFQYGSSVLPQTSGIKTRTAGATTNSSGHSEAFAELMKSRHNFAKSSHNCNMDVESYSIDIDNAPGLQTYATVVGKHANGLDLELVSGKSQEIISGLNTNGMNTALVLTFDTTSGFNQVGSTMTAWCEYDAFINIAPGLATTVSF